jgi:hypothetical protein
MRSLPLCLSTNAGIGEVSRAGTVLVATSLSGGKNHDEGGSGAGDARLSAPVKDCARGLNQPTLPVVEVHRNRAGIFRGRRALKTIGPGMKAEGRWLEGRRSMHDAKPEFKEREG